MNKEKLVIEKSFLEGKYLCRLYVNKLHTLTFWADEIVNNKGESLIIKD